ncbi:MAG: hypothetical protein GF308_03980 [Candidatus Heimdallarchaeota archaeon]|nr:hypothetical protein [Candidatus Heimdallarchaeota archaeon]
MLEVTDAIKNRRTVRRFSDEPISEEVLHQLIEVAIHAPSACDIQGWKFIILDDDELLQKIIQKDAAVFIKRAPLRILVLYDNLTDNIEYQDHIQSAAAAIQNMLLQATALGLGSCWVCHLPRKKEIRKILHIPGYFDPIAIVLFGYPKKDPKPRPRKGGIDDFLTYNTFDFEMKTRKERARKRWKRFLRKVYYRLPFRNLFRKKVNKRFEKRFEPDEVYEE